MKYVYTEIKEEKRCRGCVISRLFIRYPSDVGSERINEFFKSEANGFFKFIMEKVFSKIESEFIFYLENGGRRAHFLPRDFRFTAEISEVSENVISVKTEALYTENNSVKAKKSFSDLFDTETGTLIRKRKAEKVNA